MGLPKVPFCFAELIVVNYEAPSSRGPREALGGLDPISSSQHWAVFTLILN